MQSAVWKLQSGAAHQCFVLLNRCVLTIDGMGRDIGHTRRKSRIVSARNREGGYQLA